jgi:hypothetical protein
MIDASLQAQARILCFASLYMRGFHPVRAHITVLAGRLANDLLVIAQPSHTIISSSGGAENNSN